MVPLIVRKFKSSKGSIIYILSHFCSRVMALAVVCTMIHPSMHLSWHTHVVLVRSNYLASYKCPEFAVRLSDNINMKKTLKRTEQIITLGTGARHL